MTELTGMRILVTGASGELGSRIVRGLLERGARVAASGRDELRLAGLGSEVEAYQVDLATPGTGAALIGSVAGDGPIDGAVFAHGSVAFGTVAETPASVAESLMRVNALSVIEAMTALAAHMNTSVRPEGSPEAFMVTLSGVISEMPTAGMSAYGASKSALRAFQQVAAREMRRMGIRVFDARPGHTETGLAGRAVFGSAPAFPPGLSPDAVAERIIRAITDDEKDLAPDAF